MNFIQMSSRMATDALTKAAPISLSMNIFQSFTENHYGLTQI
jgi:hypothetical protein